MELEQRQLIKKYLNLFFRRIKLLITFLFAGICAGLFVYISTPKLYESKSLIIYQQQKINPTQMSPDETRRMSEMLSTVSQQVTSRTNLEQIIKQHNLYQEMLSKVPLEDVVINMRTNHIKIKTEQRQGNVFSVTYQGADPQQVMNVTNALASKFIEENIRFREERVSETSAYVKDELRMAKQSLDKKDEIMRDYKLKYYNEMPQQRQANLERLNGLQEQYNATQNNIHNLQQTKLLILEQITLRKNISESNRLLSEGETGTPPPPGQPQDLAEAKIALQALQAKYTDQHPEVQQLKAHIKKLEEQKNFTTGEKEGVAGDQQSEGSSLSSNLQTRKLRLQLKEIEMSLAQLKKNQVETMEHINKYQEWIDAAPYREAEWSALTRDYKELRKHYDQLVSRSLAAESAETLERRQKGSQFKIIDPAYLPQKPIKANFYIKISASVAIALGICLAIILALDFFDTSFRDAADIEKLLGIPVICSIPVINTENEKRKQKIISVWWGAAFSLSGIAMIAGFVFLWKKGLIII